MSYDIHERLDKLGPRMNQLNAGASVEYVRPGVSSVTIPYVLRNQTALEDTQGLGLIVIESRFRDYVFDASRLGSFDPPYPKPGDRILDGSLTCDVVEMGGQTHRYTTATQKRIRVHTVVTADPTL